MTDIQELLPELKDWNDGRGISVHTWLQIIARSDAAVAYADLLWPSFVVEGEYILRKDYDRNALKDWQASTPPLSAWQIEAVMNTVYLDDLLFGNEEWSPLVERRAIHLGGILRQIHTLKLASDFPDRQFTVEFWDGTQEGSDEISLSFWQHA